MNAVLKPSLRYRPMSEYDLEHIVEIERSAYTHPWNRGIFSDCLKYGSHCFILEYDYAPGGYGVMNVAVGEAHILNLCIAPELQGRGLGRGLLKVLLATARRHGATIVFLEVRTSNKAAYKLYHKQGFNEVGLRRNYYPNGKHKREDAVIMALELVRS